MSVPQKKGFGSLGFIGMCKVWGFKVQGLGILVKVSFLQRATGPMLSQVCVDTQSRIWHSDEL